MTELSRARPPRDHPVPREREGDLRRHRGPRRRLLETVDSPALRHAFDPANYVEVGQPIDEAWGRLRHFVKHFHVKDYDAKLGTQRARRGRRRPDPPPLAGRRRPAATTASACSSRTWSSPSCRTASPAPNGSPTPSPPSRASSTSRRSPTSERRASQSRPFHRETTSMNDMPIESSGLPGGERSPAGPSLSLGSRGVLAAEPTGKPAAGKIGDFKISLAEWSLHKALVRQEDRQPRLPQDRPRGVRHRRGRVRQPVLQGQGPRLGLPQGPQEARQRRRRDLRPDHDRRRGRPERRGRRRSANKAVENHKKWVDAAAALGCHAIRVNTGKHYSPTDVGARRRGLRHARPSTARRTASTIICENHGGPSSNPDALIALMKAVDKPTFGTLPDFGNFPQDRTASTRSTSTTPSPG